MTATGPDKGTPELTAARIKANIRANAPGNIDEIQKAYVDYRSQNNIEYEYREDIKAAFPPGYPSHAAAHVIYNLIRYTGELPEDQEERRELLRLVNPEAVLSPGNTLFYHLGAFQQWAQYCNMNAAYKKGKIGPELVEVLTDKYDYPEDVFQEALKGTPETFNLLQYLKEQGRLDFEPFRGKHDTETNWPDFYRIAFQPLPGIVYPLDQTGDTEKKIRAEIVAALLLQTQFLLKGVKNVSYRPQKAAYEKEYFIKPLPVELLGNFATVIETQYQRRKKEKTPRTISPPFPGESTAGFYINPETCKITDLRPYTAELNALMAVKSWDYLKEYATTIRQAIADFTGEPLPKKKRPQPPSIFENAFIKMFNVAPTNSIININTSISGRPGSGQTTEPIEKNRKKLGNVYFEQDIFTNEWVYKDKGTEINIPVKEAAPVFSTSTWKLSHFACLLFSDQNSKKGPAEHLKLKVETSVREYMNATGRKITVNNVKDTTKILKRDLETLNELTLKHTDKKYSLERVRPFPEVSLQRGKIVIGFSPSFGEYLAKKTGFLMNYPAALLKLKENNPNIYPLGYKLALNRSNDRNIRQGKANLLSVPVCLECCPGIPTIAEVRKAGRSPANRIIEPFEKALDALQEQGLLERWEYCLSKGEPLGNADVSDYNYFESLYVLYEIKDFPMETELERIKATDEKRKKRNDRIDRLTDNNIARARAKKILEAEEAREAEKSKK